VYFPPTIAGQLLIPNLKERIDGCLKMRGSTETFGLNRLYFVKTTHPNFHPFWQVFLQGEVDRLTTVALPFTFKLNRVYFFLTRHPKSRPSQTFSRRGRDTLTSVAVPWLSSWTGFISFKLGTQNRIPVRPLLEGVETDRQRLLYRDFRVKQALFR
jgi:hypothetical protein